MNITRKLTVTGLVVLLIIGATVPGLAQNAGPDEARRVESLSAREMFEEVNRFARDRFSEIEGAGIAVSDELRNETAENQRRLADRYLTLAKSRDGNSGDDLYYIGMLGWISQDFENATAFLARYIDSDSDNRERKQVSRSVMVVMLARTGQFERAGKLLEGYLEGGPEKPRERLRMESISEARSPIRETHSRLPWLWQATHATRRSQSSRSSTWGWKATSCVWRSVTTHVRPRLSEI